jgi:hypothetical protein
MVGENAISLIEVEDFSPFRPRIGTITQEICETYPPTLTGPQPYLHGYLLIGG